MPGPAAFGVPTLDASPRRPVLFKPGARAMKPAVFKVASVVSYPDEPGTRLSEVFMVNDDPKAAIKTLTATVSPKRADDFKIDQRLAITCLPVKD